MGKQIKRGSKSGEKFIKVHKSSQNIDIYELSETGNSILNLSLQFPEMTDEEIGNKLNVTREWVCKVKQTPAYKKVFQIYQKKAIDIILESRTEAAIKMKSLIASKDERVSLKACENVLGDDLKEKASDNKPIEVIIKYE